MYPTLVDHWGLKFHAYPTMLSAAFLVCTLLTVRDFQRRYPSLNASPQGGLWAFVGALIGAKVYWILQYSEPKYLWHAVFFWEGGMVFYGGLIGGIIWLFIYLKIHRLPVLKAADTAAPYLALGEAITRVGCFLNGCCWGRPTSVWWGVTFPRYSYAYQGQVNDGIIAASAPAPLPVHPTQLYMVVGLLAVAAALKLASRRELGGGTIALLYLFLYGGLRFTVEAFRADSAQSVLGMTVSQFLSLFLAVAGAGGIGWMLVRCRRAFAQNPSSRGDPGENPE